MAHRTKLTDRKRTKFLELLAAGNTVVYAAEELRVARQSLYDCRERDPEFREAWETAYEAGTQVMEQEARRRAVEGVTEPQYSLGKYVGDTQKYSDPLLMFLLKGRRPEMYRENSRHEIVGKGGGPIETRSTNDPDEALDQAERAYLAALRAKSARTQPDLVGRAPSDDRDPG